MKNSLVVAVVVVAVLGLGWWLINQDRSLVLNEPEAEGVEIGQSEVVRKLTATTWAWQETTMSDGAVITPNQAGAFTLTFGADGSVNGTTDCNNFFNTYTLNDTEIEFGVLGMTMMYCEGAQESEFIRQLENTQFVFFDDNDNLVLLLRYDSGSVIFAPVSL